MSQGLEARDVRDIAILLLLVVLLFVGGRSLWHQERAEHVSRYGSVSRGIAWIDQQGRSQSLNRVQGRDQSDAAFFAAFRVALEIELAAYPPRKEP